jgi:hypothetical protein
MGGVRVFISSVIKGYEALRGAAASGARVLGHDVLRSEDIPAGPDTAERACLDLVRKSDVVVTLLGARYGAPTAREQSPTHQEYAEARAMNKDVLAFVQRGVEPEVAQKAFIDEVRAWATGSAIASFSTPEDLRDAVIRSLKELELSRAAGRVDPEELVARGRGRSEAVARSLHEPSLVLAIAPGPSTPLLRPTQMANTDFQRDLERDALYGKPSVLLAGAQTRRALDHGSLLVAQDRGRVVLDADGTLVIAGPAETPDDFMASLVQEDIVERLAAALRFAGATLDRLDTGGRVTDVAPIAALVRLGYTSWRTRAEAQRERGRMTMNVQHGEELVVVTLRPPSRRRRALTAEAREIAEDLAQLLRQEVTR